MRVRLMAAALAVLVITAAGFAQGNKTPTRLQKTDFLVSSEAGWVNVVEGDVAFKRGDADWDMLIAGDELQTGDAVKTGSDGRAELLLNPGSYLRLSDATEAVFTDTSLDDLAIRLVRGSAIIEVSTVAGWEGTLLTLTTPKGKFSIVRGGVYRFNVDETGRSEILVRKGRLVIEGDTPVTVKDGKRIVLEGGTPMIASFDKKAEDQFDLWSKTRAEILVAANRNLSRRRGLSRAAFGFSSGSLWLFDPFRRCYTFLPGFWGYRSPYGGSYSFCNPYFRPWAYRPNTTYSSGGTSSPSRGGGGWSNSSGGGTVSRPGPSSAPRSSGTVNNGGGWSRGGGGTINRPSSRP